MVHSEVGTIVPILQLSRNGLRPCIVKAREQTQRFRELELLSAHLARNVEFWRCVQVAICRHGVEHGLRHSLEAELPKVGHTMPRDDYALIKQSLCIAMLRDTVGAERGERHSSLLLVRLVHEGDGDLRAKRALKLPNTICTAEVVLREEDEHRL